MFSEHIAGFDRYHAMIVIGDLYVQERWELRKPLLTENESIGRRDSDIVSGTGAIVATIYSLVSKKPTRLITVVGRDAVAQRVREWNSTQQFDLVPTIVAARTGHGCRIADVNGTIKCLIKDTTNNLLLSQSMVQANINNWGEAVCVSLNMGTNTLQTVFENAESFSALYIIGSHSPISNYHHLRASTILFLTVSQLTMLWGKKIESREDLSSALCQIAKLGIKTICALVSTSQVAIYSENNVMWFGGELFRKEEELDDFIFGLYVGILIARVESGKTLPIACSELVEGRMLYEEGRVDEVEYLRALILHD
ncbi:hypothetical protein [Sulfobacillus thermosulfidooxidans]|uniref:hypothetical protein n=1 Tax=Sulfobacillus thermosulfidooxidans TaxID=28034 RepID=UPI0002F71E39|nr:hypothetical protein [Sulfobacillus thermosulfidooxidans]